MFGGLFNKKEKAEYEAAVKQMELQQMQHQMQMQKEIQKYRAGPGLLTGSIHTGSIGSITQVTQAQMAAQGVVGDSGSTILRNMQDDIRGLRVSIEHLNGFYKWIIHAYPETLVQYKALKDLEAASRGQEDETKSAI